MEDVLECSFLAFMFVPTQLFVVSPCFLKLCFSKDPFCMFNAFM